MYSTARRMALLSAIGCAINIVGLLLFLLVSATLTITFAASFAIFMFMISAAAICLMLTLGLRSICQDLEYEYEDTYKKMSEMNKRIHNLENRM